jgi:pimeloyl-ACP methyl ester carboxylesterase
MLVASYWMFPGLRTELFRAPTFDEIAAMENSRASARAIKPQPLAEIGDYETSIARDRVRWIDDRCRTLPSRDSRGLAGFSMGGWGAMHLGLKFPDVFSVVAQHGDVSRYLGQPVRLNGIKLVPGTADNIVPISETRPFTNALAKAGIRFSYGQHPGDHTFQADLALPFRSSLLAVEPAPLDAPFTRLPDAALGGTAAMSVVGAWGDFDDDGWITFNSLDPVIGLGDANIIDTLRIEWPSGIG